MLWVLLFVVALHTLMMLELTGAITAVGVRVSGGRVVVVMLGAVLVAIGNLLSRTRPNVAVGVRRPRTLNNAELWHQVHRISGYVTVGLGTTIVLTGLFLHHSMGPVVGSAGLVAVLACGSRTANRSTPDQNDAEAGMRFGAS